MSPIEGWELVFKIGMTRAFSQIDANSPRYRGPQIHLFDEAVERKGGPEGLKRRVTRV